MSFRFKLFLGYFALIALATYFFLNIFIEEIQPGVRQAMEETMVDTANMLADIAAPEMVAGTLNSGNFNAAIKRFKQRNNNAKIWKNVKTKSDIRVYITDLKGVVIFDSDNGRDVGKDYSRWNDVYLTLRGKYGARSSKELPGSIQSVSYVAAPIFDNGNIIGSLSVGKPNISVQPYIELARNKIEYLSILMLLAVVTLGIIFSWIFSLSVRRLVDYARNVSAGQRTSLPKIGGREFAELGKAMENMRLELEGKAYVERYVETLTHEMKSPLAGISSAAELLSEDMDKKERQRFISNIRSEAVRLHDIIERMLGLAVLEKRQVLENKAPVDVVQLTRKAVEDRAAKIKAKRIIIEDNLKVIEPVSGDEFLLNQAIGNLLDNSIDFAPRNGVIKLTSAANIISVEDNGSGIPEYALERVFERFYSLPRPDTGKKSSGLGLNFVREIMQLHKGSVKLENIKDQGFRASLQFGLPANNS